MLDVIRMLGYLILNTSLCKYYMLEMEKQTHNLSIVIQLIGNRDTIQTQA